MADRNLTHAASLVPIGAHAGKPAMPLTRPVVSIGAGKHNRIQLKSDTVSTTHAMLVHTEAGWYVRDLGSRTHTILNGKVAKEATLRTGDTITIGAFTFNFVTNERGEDIAPPPAALEITDAEIPLPIDTKTTVIGRRLGCEVRLLEESVSLVHAILYEIDGTHYVRDLYSRTGTFLNGRKIHQEALAFGDEIVVGETSIRYVPDTSVEAAEGASPAAGSLAVLDGIDTLEPVDPPIEESAEIESVEPEAIASEPDAIRDEPAIDARLPQATDDIEASPHDDAAGLDPLADENTIPLSPTARDTIDADSEHGLDDVDGPVVPLGRRREPKILPDPSVASESSDPLVKRLSDRASDVAEVVTPESVTAEEQPEASTTVPEATDARETTKTSTQTSADSSTEMRPPDVIARSHPGLGEVPPAPPADSVALAAPEAVDEFADTAEAPAPVTAEADDSIDSGDAVPATLSTAALHSPLEPSVALGSQPSSSAEAADRAATPAEADELAKLEAQVRSALEDPTSVGRLPSLLSGEANVAAQRLGEATRRAKLIAEMLEQTEGFEVDAERETIDFASDAGRGLEAGSIVAPLDDASATIEPLEFEPIADVTLPDAPALSTDGASLPPIDESSVPPLALGLEEPSAFKTDGADIAPREDADPLVPSPLGAEARDEADLPAELVKGDRPSAPANESVAELAEDEVIDVVDDRSGASTDPQNEIDRPQTIAESVSPDELVAAEEEATSTRPGRVDDTPTSLDELQSAMPAPATTLAAEEPLPSEATRVVEQDETPIEVSDGLAPIEADAPNAGDVIATAPIVTTGPLPEAVAAAERDESLAAAEDALAESSDRDAQARLHAKPVGQSAADAENNAGEVAVDQSALDAATERLDAEPRVEAKEFVDRPTDANEETSALEHEPRPLIAADEHLGAPATDLPLDLEHLTTVEALATIESPVLKPADTVTQDSIADADADALDDSLDAERSTSADGAISGVALNQATVEAVPTESAPAILTGPADDDQTILAAAGLVDLGGSIEAADDATSASPSTSFSTEPGEASIADPAGKAVDDADRTMSAEAGEPLPVVTIDRPTTSENQIDDAFADALAMADGHTFAPAELPPAQPIDPRLAEQWTLDESLLEQSESAGKDRAVDPLAAGLAPHVEGFLNLGGIGYIGDDATDEYEPADESRPSRRRKPRTRRPVVDEPSTTGGTPNSEEMRQSDAPPDGLSDAPETSGARARSPEVPLPGNRPARPATPPRPRRKPPARKNQAAVEQSFASSAPTSHSPFAEQALPLVDAFSQQPLDGLDSMLSKLNGDEHAPPSPGQVVDHPPIVRDTPQSSHSETSSTSELAGIDGPPNTSVSDLTEVPQPPRVRPAAPTPTPFASHVPITTPTPPRPRRATTRKPANRLPILLWLMLLSTVVTGLAAWSVPVSRTVQGAITFENLENFNSIERQQLQDSLRERFDTLAGPARARLIDVFGDGFLDHPEQFRQVVGTARFDPEAPNQLFISVESNHAATELDAMRLKALLEQYVESAGSMLSERTALQERIRKTQEEQTAAIARLTDVQRRLEKVKPQAESYSNDRAMLTTIEAELAQLDAVRKAKRESLAARESELRRLEAEAAAMGVTLRITPLANAASITPDAIELHNLVANEAIEVDRTSADSHLGQDARLVRASMHAGSSGATLRAGQSALTAGRSFLAALRSPASGLAVVATVGQVDASVADANAQANALPRNTEDADLAKLAAERDAAKAALDQLLKSQSPEARQARESFDAALEAFAGDVETAGKVLGDRPEVLAYVQSARALQDQIRRITDTLVRRQQTQVTRLGEFKRRLAELTDSTREERYAVDDQLKVWNDRLAIQQRRLSAAREAGASAQEIDDIQRELQMLESTIAGRKELLDDPRATIVTKELEAMIATTSREMEQDREQNEKLLADVQEAFRRQQPAIEQLPADQKKITTTLAGRLAQIDLARRRYTNALGMNPAGSDAVAIAQARDRFEALDQQLTQRRSQLDTSAQAQAAEMERRTRVARSLDEARAAVMSARASLDAAEAAYAEKIAALDAAAARLAESRIAAEQKDALSAELATLTARRNEYAQELREFERQIAYTVVPTGVVSPHTLPSSRFDLRFAVGTAGMLLVGCAFAPLLVQELRRRRLQAIATPLTADRHEDEQRRFPPQARIA